LIVAEFVPPIGIVTLNTPPEAPTGIATAGSSLVTSTLTKLVATKEGGTLIVIVLVLGDGLIASNEIGHAEIEPNRFMTSVPASALL
jgi:hypothetical protein